MKSPLWQKIPVSARVMIILLGIPTVIALSRILLERHFSRTTALYIMVVVLAICSLPLMLKKR